MTTTPSPLEDPSESGALDVLALLHRGWRRRRYVLFGCALAGTVAFATSWLAAPVYEARTTIDLGVLGSVDAIANSDGVRAILTDPAQLSSAVRGLDVDARSVRVLGVAGTRTVRLEVRRRDAATAARVSEALANAVVEAERAAAEKRRRLTTSRLESARAEVQRLTDEERVLTGRVARLGVKAQALIQLQSQLSGLRAQIAEQRGWLDAARRQLVTRAKEFSASAYGQLEADVLFGETRLAALERASADLQRAYGSEAAADQAVAAFRAAQTQLAETQSRLQALRQVLQPFSSAAGLDASSPPHVDYEPRVESGTGVRQVFPRPLVSTILAVVVGFALALGAVLIVDD
jgi:uncharacterized protein involved in exopolysaccharide biosynthesis